MGPRSQVEHAEGSTELVNTTPMTPGPSEIVLLELGGNPAEITPFDFRVYERRTASQSTSVLGDIRFVKALVLVPILYLFLDGRS